MRLVFQDLFRGIFVFPTSQLRQFMPLVFFSLPLSMSLSLSPSHQRNREEGEDMADCDELCLSRPKMRERTSGWNRSRGDVLVHRSLGTTFPLLLRLANELDCRWIVWKEFGAV